MVGHRYSEEEHEFLRAFIPGHTYKEIVAEYNKKFAELITEERVKGYMNNHKIKNGLTGRFKKGNIPFNKGQKGVCAKGCEKTWFKKGGFPPNTKPIGYERITKDGYVEVKIKMRPSRPNCNDNFVAKHRIIWEKAHGSIPKGYNVIFLDGNKKNCSLDNLALVSKAEILEMARRNLISKNKELTQTGIMVVRAAEACRKAKRKRKEQSMSSKEK